MLAAIIFVATSGCTWKQLPPSFGPSGPTAHRRFPFQYTVAEALRLPDAYFDSFRADLRRKRDLLGDGLRAAGFEVYQPQGTYFITTDITPLGEKDAYAFCRALPERCGVVAIPNSVFYDDPDAGRSQVRFAFCKRDDVLDEATSRLRRLAS